MNWILESEELAGDLVEIMGLNGAKAGPGDVKRALDLLGLQLTPREPEITDKQYSKRRDAQLEYCPCTCDHARWCRLRDGIGVGAGWWHPAELGDWGFRRTCPEGGHKMLKIGW